MAEKKLVFVAVAAILAASVAMAGCVGQEESQAATATPGEAGQPGAPGQNGFQGPGNYSGPRGNGNFAGGPRNFSPEFEQQFAAACAGKAQGDNCTMATPSGETAGVCEARNATLSCRPRFPNQRNASPGAGN